jgi:predicted transcriptional regulator
MTEVQDTGQTSGYPLDVSMEAFPDIVNILNALGNEDALALFLYAKNGIMSSKHAIRELRLTQKRYYSRLKDLLDNNLIEKIEGEYIYTALGSIMYNLGMTMEGALLNKDKLRIMNQLNKAKNISDKERKELMELFSIEELAGESVSKIKLVDTFEEAVHNVLDLMENAKKSIRFCSKYSDIRVSQACLKAMERGVDTYFIVGDQDQFEYAFNLIKPMITNPKYLKMILQFLKSPQMNIRYIDIPYTFLIIDEMKSMIEIPKPFTNTFSLSIFFDDEILSSRMVENFNILWEIGVEINDTVNNILKV